MDDKLEFSEVDRNGMIWRIGENGDHATITEAIHAALPGDMLLLEKELPISPEEQKEIDCKQLTLRIRGQKTGENCWFLCGDSTMCEYAASRYPRMGWGQALRQIAGEQVMNLARSGRSSKSFVDEGLFDRLKDTVQAGDVILVQFGHNDEKDDPLRHTDAKGSYQSYLQAYISLAREKGAVTLFLTSMARRRFKNGLAEYTHGAYPAAMKELAAREGIPCLDMEAETMSLLSEKGEEGSKEWYLWLQPGTENYPEGAQDNSHLQERGAMLFAQRMLPQIRRAIKEMKEKDK